MPFFEYQCSSCNKVHEVLQMSGDSDLTSCPDCQGKVEKLVSLSSFSLKGTGWYTTDYKKSGSSMAKPSSETSSAPATGGGGCGSGACGKGHQH